MLLEFRAHRPLAQNDKAGITDLRNMPEGADERGEVLLGHKSSYTQDNRPILCEPWMLRLTGQATFKIATDNTVVV